MDVHFAFVILALGLSLLGATLLWLDARHQVRPPESASAPPAPLSPSHLLATGILSVGVLVWAVGFCRTLGHRQL
ncbi:MAG: hypothetical protein IVW57_07225 [Ktedonobacterales bacterium]|nr:hypothetical protein [Ktedonobacterales bacterium]